MTNTFRQYFRCPDEFDCFRITTSAAADQGFFRFGNDAICFGRVDHAEQSVSMPDALWDACLECRIRGGVCDLPFDPDEVARNLRHEKYVLGDTASVTSGGMAGKLVRGAYYAVRPLLPVNVRKHLQRRALRGWDRIPFPRWPVDVSVDALMQELMSLSIRARDGDSVPFIWFWPDGYRGALIITHDVETAAGRDYCSTLMDVTAARGFRSSFQIVPERRYDVPDSYLDEIRSRGFEVNLHGLYHDGHLFRSGPEFKARATQINAYARKWGAAGFRSPVLYRNADWMDALEFEYDLTFPNVAHLDPQRGGCCTVMPYFLGRMVELPLTTTQDYSLFHILRTHSLDLWKQQVDRILANDGLVSILVHPDYVIDEKPRAAYAALLDYLREVCDARRVWAALPRDAASWWRRRNELKLVQRDGLWRVEGEGAERARVAFARISDDALCFDVDASPHFSPVAPVDGSDW
ncbi:MAG: hypothetical protein AMXMBFR4_00430 [Candidatus Hydrogenedentota bacterium]